MSCLQSLLYTFTGLNKDATGITSIYSSGYGSYLSSVSQHRVFGFGQLLSADDLQHQLLLHLTRPRVLEAGVEGPCRGTEEAQRLRVLPPIQDRLKAR